jgi:hypothetical protein
MSSDQGFKVDLMMMDVDGEVFDFQGIKSSGHVILDPSKIQLSVSLALKVRFDTLAVMILKDCRRSKEIKRETSERGIGEARK